MAPLLRFCTAFLGVIASSSAELDADEPGVSMLQPLGFWARKGCIGIRDLVLVGELFFRLGPTFCDHSLPPGRVKPPKKPLVLGLRGVFSGCCRFFPMDVGKRLLGT